MKNTNKNLSFPKFVVGNLPLSRLLLTEEKQPNLIKKVEDPRQKHSGMTTDFMGFTLIELLVVVLIIGILAAVALPQYQKIVDKARFLQAVTVMESVWRAQQQYHLANGVWSTKFDELDIDVPTPTAKSADNFYTFSWGDCWLYSFYGACTLRLPEGTVRYHIGWDSGKRQCYVNPSEHKRGNDLCKAVTKHEGKESGIYRVYDFD